jgi:8-oxo-dGTP pyrophosphatase MutT (NUDIX family)
MPKTSAGLLLFRDASGGLEVLLVHPGGPFWSKKDEGAWSIPKGELGEGEDPLEAARREFEEETGAPASGEAIPLGSRIIEAADTHDVMTSRDSYRRPVSSEAALAELRRVSGSQLDPVIVETFVQMIEQRRVTFRHADHADFELELNFELFRLALSQGDFSFRGQIPTRAHLHGVHSGIGRATNAERSARHVLVVHLDFGLAGSLHPHR